MPAKLQAKRRLLALGLVALVLFVTLNVVAYQHGFNCLRTQSGNVRERGDVSRAGARRRTRPVGHAGGGPISGVSDARPNTVLYFQEWRTLWLLVGRA